MDGLIRKTHQLNSWKAWRQIHLHGDGFGLEAVERRAETPCQHQKRGCEVWDLCPGCHITSAVSFLVTSLLLAMADDTIFGKILRGEIPCDEVYSDELCLAFRDVAPQAPTHVLVIPRQPIESLRSAGESDEVLLGHLLLVAARVAKQEGLNDWRTVINSGAGAGQTVFHLHVHVIGGRPLAWPPG